MAPTGVSIQHLSYFQPSHHGRRGGVLIDQLLFWKTNGSGKVLDSGAALWICCNLEDLSAWCTFLGGGGLRHVGIKRGNHGSDMLADNPACFRVPIVYTPFSSRGTKEQRLAVGGVCLGRRGCIVLGHQVFQHQVVFAQPVFEHSTVPDHSGCCVDQRSIGCAVAGFHGSSLYPHGEKEVVR